MPKRLTDKFIQIASSVFSSSVLKNFLEKGRRRVEIAFVKPLSSHTCISPNQTLYVARREAHKTALLLLAERSVSRKFCGEVHNKNKEQERKRMEKIKFIG